jgi:MYXO-CTERM domain-containing protein
MRSLSLSYFRSFVLVLGFALVGGGARADIAPPDRCNSAGAACANAGPSYNSPGVCTADTCSHTLPPVNGGAPMTTTYACMTCKVTSADAGADAAATDATSSDATVDGVAGDASTDVSSGAGGKGGAGGSTPGTPGTGGASAAGGSTAPGKDDSGDSCAYVAGGSHGHFPGAVTLGLALLGAFLRRRSRRV